MANGGIGDEAAKTGGGGERKIGRIVARKSAHAFMPVCGFPSQGKLHPEAGLEGGNGEVCRAEVESAFELKPVLERECARRSRLDLDLLRGLGLGGCRRSATKQNQKAK